MVTTAAPYIVQFGRRGYMGFVLMPTTNKEAYHMTEATAPKTPRTLAQKIEQTRALLAKYEQELISESILNNIEPGDDVTFPYGRTGSPLGVRDLVGKVVAVADTDQGKIAAIQTGEGLDVQVVKVRVAAIKENRTAVERTAAAEPVEGAPEVPSEEAPVEAAPAKNKKSGDPLTDAS